MYLNVLLFEVIDSMANLSVIQYTNEKWSLLLKVAHWWQRSYGIYKCQSSARTNRKREILYVYIHVHIYIVVCPWMLKVNNILQEGSPRPAIKCRVLGKQYHAIICKLLGIFICIYYFPCHLYPILLCTFLSFHLLLGYFYWYFIYFFFAIFATWQTALVVVAAAANCLCQLLLLLLLLNLLGSCRTELPACFAIAQNKRIIHVCAWLSALKRETKHLEFAALAYALFTSLLLLLHMLTQLK